MAEQGNLTQTNNSNLVQEQKDQGFGLVRWLMIGVIAVVLVAIGAVVYKNVYDNIIFPGQPVARVGDRTISTRDWQVQVRYNRYLLISQYERNAKVYASVGIDPSQMISILNNPVNMGDKVLDQMINDAIIHEQAEKLGITIPQQEVDRFLQNTFLYYPNGTPTPSATPTPWNTPTLNPTELFLLYPSGTPAMPPGGTEPASANAEPLGQPAQTSTPYTQPTYQAVIKNFIETTSKNGVAGFSDADLRRIIEEQVYHQEVQKYLTKDIPVVQDQVWVRHIVTFEQASAAEALNRLKSGQDWKKITAEVSIDDNTRFNSGNLGWFPKGILEPNVEKAAFSLAVGQFSEPVQTQAGWEIIQVVGHENRPVDAEIFKTLQNKIFQDWLTGIRNSTPITKYDYWKQRVPTDPSLNPAESSPMH